MSLSSGARLGPYTVLSAIGVGGMGEVYRARDTRLNRDVAIKILPDLFAADADRVARFQREAQVLATLNHPHIAQIYGVEDRALVLELVNGPTLAERIAQGPLPLDEALPIARQIAKALEAAHEHGIVHRDLKPANIKLTADGTVKVLDFGLAKAASAAEAAPYQHGTPGSAGQGPANLLSQSPTITSPAMHTHAGIILGTAVYMSPEQAKGKLVDKRSDIWAFGCVLYEMLTSKRAFDGEDLTDVVAAVVRGDPDWTALPATLPPHVHAVLKGCLEKDRKARFGDIAVVRYLLDTRATESAAPAVAASLPARSRGWLLWSGVAASIVLAAGAVVAVWRPWATGPAPATPVHLAADVGADISLFDSFGSAAVLSPNGQMMAFVGARNTGEAPALYVRQLSQLSATLLTGTEGATSPFFSPDGQWIGFFAVGKLKKVSVTGGSPVALCDVASGRGGAWAPDGTIYFTPSGQPKTGLKRVSSEGGTPADATPLAEGELTQRWPQVLPGGRALVFTSASGVLNFETASIVAQPLPEGARKVLVKGGTYGRYVQSGHLVYYRNGTLFAVPFDVERLEVTGAAVPVLDRARANPTSGGAQFDISSNGTLMYTPGEAVSETAPFRWLDRTGRLSILRNTPSNWSNPSFSPDGRLLAVDINDGVQSDIWIYDWSRDTLSRLTFNTADDQRPVWSPDGSRIAFASRRGDASTFNLYWQRADGTGEAERLTTSQVAQYPTSFHPNGRVLAFGQASVGGSGNVMMLPLEGDEKKGWKTGTPTAFLQAPYAESSGMFSPDGRWVAYMSNEGGRNDIFVQPYPGPGAKVQISNATADDPSWSRAAREFFFLDRTDLRIMVVTYSTEGGVFRAAKPMPLNDTRIAGRPRPPSRDLDVHPDGQRFVVAGPEEQTSRINKVAFVFNFFDELRRVAPGQK